MLSPLCCHPHVFTLMFSPAFGRLKFAHMPDKWVSEMFEIWCIIGGTVEVSHSTHPRRTHVPRSPRDFLRETIGIFRSTHLPFLRSRFYANASFVLTFVKNRVVQFPSPAIKYRHKNTAARRNPAWLRIKVRKKGSFAFDPSHKRTGKPFIWKFEQHCIIVCFG